LKQNVSLSGILFGASDTLTLAAHVTSTDEAAAVRFVLKVKYTGDVTAQKTSLTVVGTPTYSRIELPPLVLNSGNVKRVIVRFEHISAAGKLWLDGSSLILDSAGDRSAVSGVLPVPAAPDATQTSN
jgi:hypothetical protein